MKNKFRSHRLTFVVLLLVLAVSLATALVVAAERNAGSPKNKTSQVNWNTKVAAESEARITVWTKA